MTQHTYVDTSTGRLKGVLHANFEGSISKFFEPFGVSQGQRDRYIDADFSKVEIYRGVPFANTIAQADLYKRSTLLSEKHDELDCTEPAPVAPQNQGFFHLFKETPFNVLKMEEPPKLSYNCLTLDIYRPHGVSEPLPVMVWIHGGGFQIGSACEYSGEFLAASRNQVIVCIQYRLGIHGFFKDNLGLWDQRVALEWVHREIANFGGDPKNVHIIGESAGAASVSHQLNYDALKSNGSDKAEPLFHKVTMMSGCSNMPGIIWDSWKTKYARELFHNFLKKCSGDKYAAENADVDTITDFLVTLTEQELVELQDKYVPHLMEKGQIWDVWPFSAPGICQIDEEIVMSETAMSKIDFSGYEVNYGMINGDGFLVAFFTATPEDLPAYMERQMIGQLLVDYFDRLKDPVAEGLKFYTDGLDYDTLVTYVESKYPNLSEIRKVASQMASFAYAPYNTGAIGPFKGGLNTDRMSFLLGVSDRTFTMPMLQNMSLCRKNGAKVRGYHIEHGMAFGSEVNPMYNNPKTGESMAQDYWDNGCNMHGDDLVFFFGALFGLKKKLKSEPQKEDYEFSLNLADFIMDKGVSFEDVDEDTSLGVTVFREDGCGEYTKNFRKIQMEMMLKTLPNVLKIMKSIK